MPVLGRSARVRIIFALALVGAATAGCGGTPPPTVAPSANASSSTAKPTAEPKPSTKASTPAPPDSRWAVGGKSLSKVAPPQLLEAFKKAGWVKPRVEAVSVLIGAYDSIVFDIEKGKANGRVQLIRPAPIPGKPTDFGTRPAECGDDPSTSPASLGTASFAMIHDAEADLCLLVQIKEGPADSAKAALDAVATSEKR
jgi:hypothetical protein